MKKFLILSAILTLILSVGCEKQPEEEPIEPPIQLEDPIEEEELKPYIDEKPEIILAEQEVVRQILVSKYGEDIVIAFEKLSKHEHFDFADKQLVIKEWVSHIGETHYDCYKIMEDGSEEPANFGGEYYIMGVYLSNEALIDLVAYHNAYVAIN